MSSSSSSKVPGSGSPTRLVFASLESTSSLQPGPHKTIDPKEAYRIEALSARGDSHAYIAAVMLRDRVNTILKQVPDKISEETLPPLLRLTTSEIQQILARFDELKAMTGPWKRYQYKTSAAPKICWFADHLKEEGVESVMMDGFANALSLEDSVKRGWIERLQARYEELNRASFDAEK
ncbi:MAG: hypothetical protein Q9218_002552 [Villophora microphyllina]